MSAVGFFQVSSAIKEKESTDWVQLSRQVAHWSMAANRLGDLRDLVNSEAWKELEHNLGLSLNRTFSEAVSRLRNEGTVLRSLRQAARTGKELARLKKQVLSFRGRYLKTEALLDFYADAVNTRTNPDLSSLLRACDVLAYRSMTELLDKLGQTTPPVLTYIDKGLGASILKSGLKLWDGATRSQVAAIKVVRHNLYRPTSLIHEAGHQVAHILGWNQDMADALEAGLAVDCQQVAELWAGWASEIAADSFAFVHTGYAAVASLHDVLDGGNRFVFRYRPGDPHPVSFIRVLLGIEMCRQFFGPGPWDKLGNAWIKCYRLEKALPDLRQLLEHSMILLPKIVEISLRTPMRAFKGRSLSALLNPERVHPKELALLEIQGGAALYTSPHWAWTEPLRLLGLTGYRAATLPDQSFEILQQQKDWMSRLGTTLH